MNDLVNPSNCKIEGTGIYLEPRLQEYFKKKETYEKYRITPIVSLEAEFGISKDDKKKLKQIKKSGGEIFKDDNGNYQGNRVVYNENISNASLGISNVLDEQFSGGFLSETIKDKKFSKMFKKHKKIKQKENEKKEKILMRCERNQNQYPTPNNTNGWLKRPDEEMIDSRYFSSDFRNKNDPYDNYKKQDTTKRRIYSAPLRDKYKQNDGNDDFFNPNELNDSDYGRHSGRSYNHPTVSSVPSKIAYNQIPHQGDSFYNPNYSSDMTQIIGDFDSYRKQVNPQFQQTSDFDYEHKINIPNISSNGKKNIDTSAYKSMPYMGSSGQIRNISDETQLLCGMPERATKSYGYTNPFENQFQYISSDIQSADHTVLPFPRGGYGTRQYNKESFTQHKREIFK
jgi:hypothetical protein